MVRHLAFFAALGAADEESETARQITAGLVVMRLVDEASSRSERGGAVYSAPAKDAVASLRESAPVKSVLFEILDCIERARKPESLCALLIRYGKTLGLESRWDLAADVFHTAGELAPHGAPVIAVEAHTLRGAAERRAGRWEASLDSYARAVNLAARTGDLPSSLKAEVGIANTYFAQGDLDSAEAMLATVLSEAKEEQMDEVLSLALHTRASVAHHRERYADAIDFAYDALKLASDENARDVILTDIAAAFVGLGLRDAARDAHLIASVTSRSAVVRSSATLNLMELAAVDGMEEAFDGYARALAEMQLEVRHRAYYLLFLGQGQMRFGRSETAAETLESARKFASINRIENVVIDAEAAIAGLNHPAASPPPAKSPSGDTLPESTRRIASELTEMRELALAGRG